MGERNTAFMIEELLNPASFPDRPKSVSLVQTHISIVFITDVYVYKVKKSVNFGFLAIIEDEPDTQYIADLDIRFSFQLKREAGVGDVSDTHKAGFVHVNIRK